MVGTAIAMLLGFHMSAYYFLPREPLHRGQVVFNILLVHSFAAGLGLLALLWFPSLLRLIFNSSDLMPYAPQIGLVILLWGSLLPGSCGGRKSGVTARGGAHHRCATLKDSAHGDGRGGLRHAPCPDLCRHIPRDRSDGNPAGISQLAFSGLLAPFQVESAAEATVPRAPSVSPVCCTLEVDYHNYYVSNHFGPANFAIYSIGCLDIPLITLLGESVSSVVIPRVSALERDQNHREIVLLMAQSR